MNRLLVVYVGQQGFENLKIGLAHGIWGFKPHVKPEHNVAPGDYIALAFGYSGGSPRVASHPWLQHSIEHVYMGRITQGNYEDTSLVWPDEAGADAKHQYRYRVRFEQDCEFSSIPLKDRHCFSAEMAEALRKSACANGRGYVLDMCDFPLYALDSVSEMERIIKSMRLEPKRFDVHSLEDARTRIAASIVAREGQPKFRSDLLKAYDSKCAISGCNAPPALEAAHIRPYLGPKTNVISNGLLLRADLHTLFDRGLIAVETRSMSILIAPPLSQTPYEEFNGQNLQKPPVRDALPNRKALDWHRKESGYWQA